MDTLTVLQIFFDVYLFISDMWKSNFPIVNAILHFYSVDFCEIIVKMTTNGSRNRGHNGNDHKDVCKIAILGCAGVGKTGT